MDESRLIFIWKELSQISYNLIHVDLAEVKTQWEIRIYRGDENKFEICFSQVNMFIN